MDIKTIYVDHGILSLYLSRDIVRDSNGGLIIFDEANFLVNEIRVELGSLNQ